MHKWLKIPALFLLLFVLILHPLTVAACGGFEMYAKMDKMAHATDKTNVFVSFKNGSETYVVKPDYTGNTKEFGIVLPFPAKPEIAAAPVNFFDNLATITAPEGVRNVVFGALPPGARDSKSVTVVEQKDVGDFTTTTLTATSAQDLIAWLKEHDFTYSTKDTLNFDYYVQKQGYYFVALKVKATAVAGRLTPLAFTFETLQPIVAMRISASTNKPMNYDLYATGTAMIFVPGTAIDYSARITAGDLADPKMKDYLKVGDWLTHAVVTMDPSIIRADLELTQARAPSAISSATVINPLDVPKEAGIVLAASTSTRKTIAVIVQPSPTMKPSAAPIAATIVPTGMAEVMVTQAPAAPAKKYTGAVFWTIILVGLGVEAVAGVLLFIFIRRKK